jgi:hypothetical protein
MMTARDMPAMEIRCAHGKEEEEGMLGYGGETGRIVRDPSARATMLVSELEGYREHMTQDQEKRFLNAVSKLGKRKGDRCGPERCQRAAASSSDCASSAASRSTSSGSDM